MSISFGHKEVRGPYDRPLSGIYRWRQPLTKGNGQGGRLSYPYRQGTFLSLSSFSFIIYQSSNLHGSILTNFHQIGMCSMGPFRSHLFPNWFRVHGLGPEPYGKIASGGT